MAPLLLAAGAARATPPLDEVPPLRLPARDWVCPTGTQSVATIEIVSSKGSQRFMASACRAKPISDANRMTRRQARRRLGLNAQIRSQPQELDHQRLLVTKETLERELQGLDLEFAHEVHRTMAEGIVHNGDSAVVRILGVKPA